MVKLPKCFLLIVLLYLPLKVLSFNIDSYFPFEIEINYLGGSLREKATIESIELIRLNPGDSVSVLQMSNYPFFKVKYKNTIGYMSASSFKYNEYFEKIKNELKRAKLIEKQKEIEERKNRLLTKNLMHRQAPYFKLKNLNNMEYELKVNSEKIILLEFWAEGCGHCITVANNLKNIEQYLIDNNVELVIVEKGSENNLKRVTSLTNKHNINKNTLYGGKEIAELYGVKGVPAFFLLDKNGIIIFSHVGSDLLESPVREVLFNLVE